MGKDELRRELRKLQAELDQVNFDPLKELEEALRAQPTLEELWSKQALVVPQFVALSERPLGVAGFDLRDSR